MTRLVITCVFACVLAMASRVGAARAAEAPDSTGIDSLRVLVPAGASRGEVLEPAGLAVDAFGRIFISDAGLHRLVRVDAAGAWLGEAGTLGSGPRELRRPGSVAPLGGAGVALLDRENRRIVNYDLFGRFLGVLVDLRSDAVDEAVGRVDPVAMAADRGGALYLTDAERDRVLAFDFAGRFVRTLGGFGARAGSFRGISGVAVAPRGELLVAERGNRRVQRVDASGRPLTTWPIDVDPGPGALALAVDEGGRVALCDELSGRVWVFDVDGRIVAARGGFRAPRAVAWAADRTLLIGDADGVHRLTMGSADAARPPTREP